MFRYKEQVNPPGMGRFVACEVDGERVYLTNNEGEGLFLKKGDGSIRQIAGTAQFSAANLAQFKRRFRARISPRN